MLKNLKHWTEYRKETVWLLVIDNESGLILNKQDWPDDSYSEDGELIINEWRLDYMGGDIYSICWAYSPDSMRELFLGRIKDEIELWEMMRRFPEFDKTMKHGEGKLYACK